MIFALRNVVGPGSIGADSILNVTILDNEPSRVKSFADASLQLYPNPSTGMVYIRDLENKITEVRVMNLSGQNIVQISASQRQGLSIPVDLNGFDQGMYMVEVTTKQGNVYTEKLILK